MPGHAHRHDHVTMVHAGWLIVLTKEGAEEGKVTQLASEEFRLHPADPIPVRFPNKVSRHGLPELDIRFIAPGEKIPEGGKRLFFAPDGDYMNIPAGTQHHLVRLSPRVKYRCWYVRGEDEGDYI